MQEPRFPGAVDRVKNEAAIQIACIERRIINRWMHADRGRVHDGIEEFVAQALTRDNLAAHRFRESLSAPRTPRANANGSACLCEGKRHSARAAASSDDQHSAATERDARFESAKDADVVRVVAVELASAA